MRQPAGETASVRDAPPENVTALLRAWGGGEADALERLVPLVYDELRRHAHRHLRREAVGHTLDTTGLVHEAYLRLADQRSMRWESRAQFFGVAAQLMRRVLVDHARAQRAAKRGGAAIRVPLDHDTVAAPEGDVDLLALDEALTRLAALSERQAHVVNLRYFAGLDIAETADVLGVSVGPVKRDWAAARAWLRRELAGG